MVFQSLKEGDSRDELMETVTTDEAVVKEYNPYREAELMGTTAFDFHFHLLIVRRVSEGLVIV